MSNNFDADLVCNDLLRDLFPQSQENKVTNLKNNYQGEEHVNYEIETRVNAHTEGKVKAFLEAFKKSSECTFNILRGQPDKRQSGGRTLSQVRGYRKCCLNVAKLISERE